jgi:hypothetical protein
MFDIWIWNTLKSLGHDLVIVITLAFRVAGTIGGRDPGNCTVFLRRMAFERTSSFLCARTSFLATAL